MGLSRSYLESSNDLEEPKRKRFQVVKGDELAGDLIDDKEDFDLASSKDNGCEPDFAELNEMNEDEPDLYDFATPEALYRTISGLDRISSTKMPEPSSDFEPINIAAVMEKNVAKKSILADDDQRQDVLSLYLREIEQYPVLTRQQELEMAREIMRAKQMFIALWEKKKKELPPQKVRNDAQIKFAKSRLEEMYKAFEVHYLRLVVKIARHTQSGKGTLDLADLIQEGNIGLRRATIGYDPEKGYKFSTYAGWWIRHYIRNGIVDKGRAIRLPAHMLAARAKYEKILHEENLISNEERQRDAAGMASPIIEEKTGMGRQKIAMVATLPQVLLSLNSPIQGDEGDSFVDLVPDEKTEAVDAGIIRRQNRVFLRMLLGTLSPKEKFILSQRFGLSEIADEETTHRSQAKTLEEVGQLMGLTRERVRQIEERALKKMKIRAEKLENLADD
jgi:RNA polymerase primary sigma factor